VNIATVKSHGFQMARELGTSYQSSRKLNIHKLINKCMYVQIT